MSDLQTFSDLWSRLCDGDESVQIEAKKGSDLGKSISETIVAFSNEPDAGGGYIIAGVTRKADSLFPDYEVVGVKNPDKIQADFATQCKDSFSSPIKPCLSVEVIDSKPVVIAYIPEASPQVKPIYIKSKGLQHGAFRRIGSTDQVCTTDDLSLFYQAHGAKQYDESPIDETSLVDVDRQALELYRRYRSQLAGPIDLLEYSDEELLYALGATAQVNGTTRLTLAGLALFGNPLALRRHMPMMRVDYIRVPGREWVANPEQRYQTVEKLGPLVKIIPAVIDQVLADIPMAFSFTSEQVQRQDVPIVPKYVLREAIVNSVMHRSYRAHGAVQIIRYANRIEIRNPGYSLVPEERLGEPGSKTRNPKIAAVLHDIGLAETKGTGVRAMRNGMAQANLTQPLFESDRVRDEFTVRLLVHHFPDQDDIQWLAPLSDCNLTDEDARAVLMLREFGAINNSIYRTVGHCDTLTASSRLRRLRDVGVVDKRGSGAATFYVPGIRLQQIALPPGKLPAQETLRMESSDLRMEPMGASVTPNEAQMTILTRVRADSGLIGRIAAIGQREEPDVINAVIVDLCSLSPLSLEDLAILTGRTSEHLRQRNIRQLMSSGKISHLYPDAPSRPDQKYVVSGNTRT